MFTCGGITRLHVAAGGGHLVLIDSADQIGPVITGFLRQDRAVQFAADEPA